MGIPSYFAWLARRHRNGLITQSPKDPITNLFLDFNGFIHTSAYRAIELIPESDITDTDLIYTTVIRETIAALEKVIRDSAPTGVILIAIDGVAPRAKIKQQRLRRYRTVIEKQIKLDLARKYHQDTRFSYWDSNAITPGTEFMARIERELRTYIEDKPQFILSPASEHGEGEHKIYDYIRKNGIEKATIFGLDADLIMLSLLATNHCSITLMRETQSTDAKDLGGYDYLDIGFLYQAIVSEMNPECITDDKPMAEIAHNYIIDYVIMCFMMGNDFIPHSISIKIHHDGISELVELYKTLAASDEFLYIPAREDGVGYLNIGLFYRIVRYLAGQETEMVRKSYHYHTTFVPRFEATTDYERELENVKYYPIYNRPEFTPNDHDWETQYYHICFDGATIDNICQKYIDAIAWNANYYIEKRVEWSWYYPYDMPPLWTWLGGYLNRITYTESNRQGRLMTSTNTGMRRGIGLIPCTDKLYIPIPPPLKSEPYPAVLQLCIALPPFSHKLLPKEIQRIAADHPEIYPTKFHFFTLMRKFFYETDPILPEINDTVIRKYIENRIG